MHSAHSALDFLSCSVFSYKKQLMPLYLTKLTYQDYALLGLLLCGVPLLTADAAFVCFFSLQRKKSTVSRANNSICVYSKIWLSKYWPLVYVFFFFSLQERRGCPQKVKDFWKHLCCFILISVSVKLSFWTIESSKFKI